MRLWLALWVLASGCASTSWRSNPPKSATVLEIAKPDLQGRTFPNGLRFAVSEAGSQLADVQLVWQVTGLDAPSTATAWLAPQMLANDPRWLTVTNQLGSQRRFRQDRDGMVMSATSLSGDVDALLNAIARLIREPRCHDRALAVQKQRLLNTLYETTTLARSRVVLGETLYGRGHVYGPLSPDDVERTTCAEILDVTKRCLGPARLAIVVSGGVKLATVERSVRGYFGALANATAEPVQPVLRGKRAVVTIETPGAAQVVITLARFIPRAHDDSAFNLAMLRESASFAGGFLRGSENIAYSTDVSIDELAMGYELQITTTVPREKAAEALRLMKTGLRENTLIHRAGTRTGFSRRMSMLQRHMLQYETVGGIGDEVGWAMLKNQPFDTTIKELYSLRDGDVGTAMLWANARADFDAMTVILAGDAKALAAALDAAGLEARPH